MTSLLFATATVLVLIAAAIFTYVAWASIRIARGAIQHSFER